MSKQKKCSRQLRDRVQVQRPDRQDDGYGGQTNDVWNDTVVIWCQVEEKTGAEKFQQHDLRSEYKAVFTTHYREDIEETDRLMLDGEAFNIRSIKDPYRHSSERRRWIEIEAERGVVD